MHQFTKIPIKLSKVKVTFFTPFPTKSPNPTQTKSVPSSSDKRQLSFRY
ncbi:hypothetical protein VDG1235_4547 [Verrucomicrobiia bacterium DG1235]|nr:hypothetical protein VDG1235_4547 [Verrucomicrobiae bacterium DG1235]